MAHKHKITDRLNRRATQSDNQVTFPVAWHRPILCFGGALADHDCRSDELLAASSCTCPWHPQRPPGPQARNQFAS